MGQAIKLKRYKYVELFLKYNGDPNDFLEYENEDYYEKTTYIQYVIQENDLKLLKLLIENGGNINQEIEIFSKDNYKKVEKIIYPLDLAIKFNNKEIINYIIKNNGIKKHKL